MREHRAGYGHRRVSGSDQRFEYLMITADSRDSLGEVRARINEHSEYGRWELARSVILYGGRRRFWLRRRVMKVDKTVTFA